MLYAIGTVFSKAVGFFLVPIYTYCVSDAEYGIATTITSFVSTFGVVIMLSLRAALIRFYNEYSEEEKPVFVGTVTGFVSVNAIVICTLLCIFNKLYSPIFFKEIDFYPLVFIGVLSLGAEGIYLTYQSLLQAKQDGRGYSANSVVYLLVHAASVVLFVWIMDLGSLGIVLSNCVTNFIFAIYGVFNMLRKGLMVFAWNGRMLSRSVRYSLPILPHNLSNNLSTYATKVIINSYIGYALSGLYTLAAQFSTIINMVQASVNLAFRPWFIEQMENGEEGRKQIKYMTGMIMSLYAFVAVMLSFFCKEIVLIMAEKSYSDAWKMVPFFIITQLVGFVYYAHVQTVMYNVKMSKFSAVCSFSGLGANIAFSLLLVSPLNIYGVLVARLLSQLVMATITVIMNRKSEKVDFGLKKMIFTIIMASVFSGAAMLISNAHYGIDLIEIIMKLVLSLVAFVLFLYPYRKDFVSLIKGLLKKKIQG